MNTIVKPKDSIYKLWGKQRINETETYRLMYYVLKVDHDGKALLQNFVTGQMVTLDQDEIEALEKLPMKYSPVLEKLVTDHYLVPESYDEYKTVNQLRKISQARPSGTAINHFTILPTTFCNARCFYCYESDYPHVQMTAETADKLIKYIDQHREGKDVTLNWFGGEPLVGIQRIDQISQGLKDRNISFTASMVSNGYLFDEEIVDRASALWKLQRIQITLDGTEDTYNRVKAYVNVRDNPFQRVLRNIDLLSARKILVNIRLNVDFYNKDDIKVLIEELGKRYSDNDYVAVYLNMLFSDVGFEPVSHSYDEMLQITRIINEYTDRLKELHLSSENNMKFLHMTISHCMADNPHSVMIQPDGSFCRCEHENIHDRYGNLDEGVTDSQKLAKWDEVYEPSEQCPKCAVYPACYHLRQCMNGDVPCIDEFQENNLEKQRKRIIAMYDHKMEVKKNEGV